MEEYLDAGGEENTDEWATLRKHQAQLGSALTRATRVKKRMGGPKQPEGTTLEKLRITEMKEMNETLRGILDVLRVMVCSTPVQGRFTTNLTSCL